MYRQNISLHLLLFLSPFVHDRENCGTENIEFKERSSVLSYSSNNLKIERSSIKYLTNLIKDASSSFVGLFSIFPCLYSFQSSPELLFQCLFLLITGIIPYFDADIVKGKFKTIIYSKKKKKLAEVNNMVMTAFVEIRWWINVQQLTSVSEKTNSAFVLFYVSNGSKFSGISSILLTMENW